MSTVMLFAFIAAASLADEGAPLVRSVPNPLVEHPALYQEQFTPALDPDLKPNQRRVSVSSRPLWYPDEQTGELTRIELEFAATTDTIDGEHAYEEQRNTIRYRFNANGVSTYRRGAYTLRTRFVQERIENASTEAVRRTNTTTRPSAVVADSATRVLAETVLPSVTQECVLIPGGVKESLIIASVPDAALSDTESVLFVFEFDATVAATIAPVLADGAIHWRNNNGQTIFTFEAPHVFDAKNQTLPSRYMLRAGRYAVAIPARALRLASYPVTIDPTATTAQDSTNNNVVSAYFADGSDDQYNDCYFKFSNMPDLTGLYSSIDAATLQLYVSSVTGAGATNFDVYFKNLAAGGSPTEGWNEASSAATLSGLSFGTATATAQTATSMGSQTYDILGDSGKGIVQIYTDDPSPDACSARLNDNTATGTSSDSTSSINIRVGEAEGSDSYATFANDNDATNYPRINITYTAAGGGGPATPRGSGSVGVIGG